MSFLDYLITNGIIDSPTGRRAQLAAESTGERLHHVLPKLGLLSEDGLAEQMSRFLNIPILRKAEIPEVAVLPDLIRSKYVHSAKTLPLVATETEIIVATTDPFETEPAYAIRYLTGLPVFLRVTTPVEFQKAYDALYSRQSPSSSTSEQLSNESYATETDIQRLRDLASEAPIIRLVSEIITRAVDSRASDIHIEPGSEVLSVRYRIDGDLRLVQQVANQYRAAITSRVKILAKLDIAERRLPQDGRIKIGVRGVDIDFRISTIPTIHGESVVIRILDRSRVELDFLKLGFNQPDIAKFKTLLKQPNGIVLVTGPTGSGKTTTLYTALRELNKPTVKIFTVEDPIEYQLAGINQIQVQTSIGLSFPGVLRSVLRQDPDIIMIGEIRDSDTAQIAVQAALTGHLVLATLHTNSAVAAINRLVDMGIERFLLASTLRGVVGQRLVRCLCQHCKARRLSPSDATNKDTQNSVEASAVGCDSCGHTGYFGRSTIVEIASLDRNMQGLVARDATDVELEASARNSGMKTMYEDGLAKIAQGVTALEEVLRVTSGVLE